jgi:hypothetical protein
MGVDLTAIPTIGLDTALVLAAEMTTPIRSTRTRNQSALLRTIWSWICELRS